ncbi:MAG: DNA polymerase III subunit beta [Candidatus Sericytochromatia bacterium]|nr:DNA polymerase III subunit beta [Candidatus Tanganyikabacteria bacterium]
MKFTCSKDDLSKGIAAVQRVVTTRGPIPILSNLLLTTGDAGVRISATDLNVGIEATVPAQVGAPGAITLAARQLSDIVAKLPNADVELALGEDGVQALVLCQRSRFVLPSLPADEFPKLPHIGEDGPVVRLPGSELARGIRQTAFAAGVRDDMSVISGLLLRLDAGALEVVATDGYRLGWWQWHGAGEGKLEVVVPARAMGELARLLGAAEGSPEVTVRYASTEEDGGKGANQILFSFGDKFLASRIINGSFPNFKQIIPESFKVDIRLDRDSFLAAVERASIMASDRDGKAIRLSFQDNELHLWARTSELGEVDEHLQIEYQGEPLEITFNAKYLDEALKALDGDTVTLRLNGSVLAALIQGADPLYQSLLMPIRS